MQHLTWVSPKASFNGVFVFWQSWVAYELQKRTNLLCLRSFIFTWPVVTKHLFFCVCFLFVCFCLFVFFFSAKTTVQWYLIVGPLLAVAVLAFVVLYLKKRRIAGTCALNFASFLGPYQDSKMRSTELKMNCRCRMKTKKNKTNIWVLTISSCDFKMSVSGTIFRWNGT